MNSIHNTDKRGKCPEPAEWHFFYILKCADGSYYVGSTRNIKKRLAIHNEGRAADFTAKRRPVRLILSETYHTLEEAIKRERQVKKWSRAKKEALIKGDIESLKTLSKGH